MKGGAEWTEGSPNSFTESSLGLATEWMLPSRTEVGNSQRSVHLQRHYGFLFEVVTAVQPTFQVTFTSPMDPGRQSTTTNVEKQGALC